VLNAAHDLEVTAKTLGDPLSGEMHLGLIPTLAPYLLPHIMPQLIGELPRMEFFLHENQTADLLRGLDQGLLDALILPWLDEMKDFDAYDLFDEPFLLAVNKGHQLAKKKRVKLDDLKGCHVLTLEDGHCLRDQALGYCFSAGADEDKRFQATSLETLRYMVASGIGITLLPKLSVIDQPDNSELTYIPFQQPMPSRRIVLLIRQNYTRGETVREIVAAIRAAMKIKLKG
jgi:LysR family hydrogen peroxide-inducible transcriptional activator